MIKIKILLRYESLNKILFFQVYEWLIFFLDYDNQLNTINAFSPYKNINLKKKTCLIIYLVKEQNIKIAANNFMNS